MIQPAILTDKKDKFLEMLDICGQFAPFTHIDIMDGLFVPTRSVGIEDLRGIRYNRFSEFHLMVYEPEQWIHVLKDFGTKKITFHFEIKKNKKDIIKEIKMADLEACLAVKPYTEIEEFSYLINDVDSILFMSVIPGRYGAPFLPRVKDKIKKFRRMYPDKTIGIDGGIKKHNLEEIYKLGVNYICVGSAIMNADFPGHEYQKFSEMTYWKKH